MTTVNTQSEVRRWNILGGPSKYDFLEALGFRKPPAQVVTFKILEAAWKESVRFDMQVFVISRYVTADDGHRDGEGCVEGHQWKFVGMLLKYYTDKPFDQQSLWVIGHYSTKSRTGEIRELDQSTEGQILEMFV